jgi:GNAT superfamily N-acetyltransferase
MSDTAETLDGVTIRRVAPGDSFPALKELLHRAYAPLAARGMRFLASSQNVSTTLLRAQRGECYVAADANNVLIGTVVLSEVAATRGSPWYDRPDVASFGQYAVEPAWQGRGIGSRMLAVVEARAAEKGVVELALDTAEGATELIAFYGRRGYRFVEHVTWPDVNYRSVIMSKAVRPAAVRAE